MKFINSWRTFYNGPTERPCSKFYKGPHAIIHLYENNQILANILKDLSHPPVQPLEPYSIAYFSIQFNPAKFIQFNHAIFIQFSAAVFIQFNPAIFIQFNPAKFIQFNPAKFIQFNPAKFIQFNPAIYIQFNPAIYIQFNPAIYIQFSPAIYIQSCNIHLIRSEVDVLSAARRLKQNFNGKVNSTKQYMEKHWLFWLFFRDAIFVFAYTCMHIHFSLF